jgi:hypothetical protein
MPIFWYGLVVGYILGIITYAIYRTRPHYNAVTNFTSTNKPCEICERSSCANYLHTLKEQYEFNTKTGQYAPKENAPLKYKEEPEIADN